MDRSCHFMSFNFDRPRSKFARLLETIYMYEMAPRVSCACDIGLELIRGLGIVTPRYHIVYFIV